MNSSVTACCAGIYELPLTQLLLGSSFHPGGLELTDRLARAVALGPGDRVLDVASGRGETALHLAQRYGVSVQGVDYSATQIEEANQRARDLGIAERASFVEGRAEELPFASGEFDVVFCECALCTFPSRPQALSEARRVLKPRGVFALSDVVVNREVPDELRSVLGHVLCIGGALSRLGYEEELTKGGFSQVRYRDVSETLLELVEQVERRISKLSGEQLQGSDEELSLSWDEVPKTLVAARDFVETGGIGYALFTARRSTR